MRTSYSGARWRRRAPPDPRPGHRPATNHPTCRQGTPGECRRPATRIAPVADPPLFRSGRRLRSNRPLVRVLPRGSAPADRDDRRRFAPGPGMRRITERDPGTISHHRRPHRGMLLPRRLSRTTLARLARILARCDLRAAVYSRGALESARGCSRLLTGEGAENDVAAGARASRRTSTDSRARPSPSGTKPESWEGTAAVWTVSWRYWPRCYPTQIRRFRTSWCTRVNAWE